MGMIDTTAYQEIAARTGGNIYIGVVGPVRSGKSTFIKRFMETIVLPAIEDDYVLERTRDELPQSGSGRTITTAEPKFVPETAVELMLENHIRCAVRMVDCVGFMISGAAGNMENGLERMVMTPWYDQEIPISRAAEEGTYRVITEHSTVGVLVTTDGSICGIDREDYISAEQRTAEELEQAGRPYVILLNCADPLAEQSQKLAQEISETYGHACIAVNCLTLCREEISMIIQSILKEFPVTQYRIYLPMWVDGLGTENELRTEIMQMLLDAAENTLHIGDAASITDTLGASDLIAGADVSSAELGTGTVSIQVKLQQQLYYQTISTESGFEIRNDRELMELLRSVSSLKEEYSRVHDALESARTTGYGIVMPTLEEMSLEEPQIVRQGGRYGVRLKASAPSIHMIMTNIETEVAPAIGGEKASEEVINFLLQGYDGDINRIWESNLFGKPLNDIAGEGLNNKIRSMPEEAQQKIRTTIQRIINEGSGGLLCIIL